MYQVAKIFRKDNMDVYVTGSHAKLLSKDIVTEFAGRGDEVHLYPLSFAEFMNVYKGDKYTGLSEYMLYGGIPLVVLRNDAMIRQRHCRICSMRFIFKILRNEIELRTLENWKIC